MAPEPASTTQARGRALPDQLGHPGSLRGPVAPSSGRVSACGRSISLLPSAPPSPDQNLTLPPSLPPTAQMSRSLRAAIPGELDTRASSDSKKSKGPTTGALSVESLRRPRDGTYVGLQFLLSCC